MKANRLVALLVVLLSCCSVSTAPAKQPPSDVAKAIGVIHHLTYLIDYLVQYVMGANDRKTPQDAADYYQKALVEGQDERPAHGSDQYRPSAARARQETEIIHKMMKA